MFKEYYEELNNINEEMLNEGNYIYAQKFWDYAKQGLVSYKNFYWAYSDDIRTNQLTSLFDANHKLVNKGTYGKIKEYNEKYPNTYFGKALLKLWVLQFKDNAEDADELEKKKAEEEKRQREEQAAKEKEESQKLIAEIMAHEDKIEAQFKEAVEEIVTKPEVIKLSELCNFYYEDDSHNLVDKDKWYYKSDDWSKDNYKQYHILFYFGAEYHLDFYGTGSDRVSSRFFEYTLNDSYLKFVVEFKEKIDNKVLKDELIKKVVDAANKCIPEYEKDVEKKKASIKAAEEKEAARVKIVNLIKQQGYNFSKEQLDKVNNIFKALVKKWQDYRTREYKSWTGYTYDDGDSELAYIMATSEAIKELSQFLGELHWAAFEDNKLKVEFDPKTGNKDDLEKALDEVLDINIDDLYFRFLKD